MALSQAELTGTRTFRPQEQAKPVAQPEQRRFYTPTEINQMIVTTPEELTCDHPIETPAGTWKKDGDITIFDGKSSEEIARITVPEAGERRKQKIIKAVKWLTQMG